MAPPGPPLGLQAPGAEAVISSGETRAAAPRIPGAEVARRRTWAEGRPLLARMPWLERLVPLRRLVGLLVLGPLRGPGPALEAILLVLPLGPLAARAHASVLLGSHH